MLSTCSNRAGKSSQPPASICGNLRRSVLDLFLVWHRHHRTLTVVFDVHCGVLGKVFIWSTEQFLTFMAARKLYNCIVVGTGGIGSGTLYWLSKLSAKLGSRPCKWFVFLWGSEVSSAQIQTWANPTQLIERGSSRVGSHASCSKMVYVAFSWDPGFAIQNSTVFGFVAARLIVSRLFFLTCWPNFCDTGWIWFRQLRLPAEMQLLRMSVAVTTQLATFIDCNCGF